MKLDWRFTAPRTLSSRSMSRPPDADMASYAALARGFFLTEDAWCIDRLPQLPKTLGATRFRLLQIKRLRRSLDEWWKQPSRVHLPGRGNSRWDIFEFFFYGRVIHQNQALDYRKLMADQMRHDLFIFCVCKVLLNVRHWLRRFHLLNEMLLSQAMSHPRLP